jgi:hypothetical protein
MRPFLVISRSGQNWPLLYLGQEELVWWLRPVLSIPMPGQNWPLQYLGQEELVAEASPVHLEAGQELASAIPWAGRAGG